MHRHTQTALNQTGGNEGHFLNLLLLLGEPQTTVSFLLTQQKEVWLQLIYISLLPCHNFLSEVLAKVRPHSILLSAVSPSACYPS